MTAALFRGGVEAVGEAFDRIKNFSGPERDQLVAKLLQGSLVLLDPPGTIELVQAQTTDRHRGEAMREAIVSWTGADFNARGRWLGEQPPSPERDKMIEGFAQTVSQLDPAAAATWAAEIADEQLRTKTLEAIKDSGSQATAVED